MGLLFLDLGLAAFIIHPPTSDEPTGLILQGKPQYHIP